jgi:hypothetical protein
VLLRPGRFLPLAIQSMICGGLVAGRSVSADPVDTGDLPKIAGEVKDFRPPTM